MTKKRVVAGVILLIVAMVGLAADTITGKWVYEEKGSGGSPVQKTLNLKAEGAKLTGTITMPGTMSQGGAGGGWQTVASPQVQISNGKAKGNNISFDLPALALSYEGVVSGDEMRLTVTVIRSDGKERRGRRVTKPGNSDDTVEYLAKRSTN